MMRTQVDTCSQHALNMDELVILMTLVVAIQLDRLIRQLGGKMQMGTHMATLMIPSRHVRSHLDT